MQALACRPAGARTRSGIRKCRSGCCAALGSLGRLCDAASAHRRRQRWPRRRRLRQPSPAARLASDASGHDPPGWQPRFGPSVRARVGRPVLVPSSSDKTVSGSSAALNLQVDREPLTRPQPHLSGRFYGVMGRLGARIPESGPGWQCLATTARPAAGNRDPHLHLLQALPSRSIAHRRCDDGPAPGK